MNKMKKMLAILSAAVMTATMAVTSVSAYFSPEFEVEILDTIATSSTDGHWILERYADGVIYDAITTNTSTGKKYFHRMIEGINFRGILVTMPDENAPIAENLGFEFKSSQSLETNVYYPTILWNNVENDVAPYVSIESEDYFCAKENQYILYDCCDPESGEELESEEEYAELAEKLIVRGLIEEASLSYYCDRMEGYIGRTWSGDDTLYEIRIDFNDEESIENFDVEKYPEIKEILQYSAYNFEINDNDSDKYIILYGNTTNSAYKNEDGIVDDVSCYNDVIALKNEMLENHDEVKNVDVSYGFKYSDGGSYSPAGSSIQPTWGDATNNDVVDLYDAIEISKHLIKSNNLDEDTLLLADINRDGKTDLYDVIDIAKTLMI